MSLRLPQISQLPDQEVPSFQSATRVEGEAGRVYSTPQVASVKRDVTRQRWSATMSGKIFRSLGSNNPLGHISPPKLVLKASYTPRSAAAAVDRFPFRIA